MRKALIASLLVCASATADVVRGPYLQMGMPDSMTVVWRSLLPSDAKVWYGDAPTALTQTATDSKVAFQHEVTLTGLEAGKRYYYAVGSGATGQEKGGDVHHYFDTSPVLGSTPNVRLWVVGDSGTGGLNQIAVFNAMVQHVGEDKPDFFLYMGDMAYGSGMDLEF